MKTVTIDVDQDGDFKIDLAGFKGKGCDKVAAAFEEMGSVKKKTLKPEYHQPDTATTKQTV